MAALGPGCAQLISGILWKYQRSVITHSDPDFLNRWVSGEGWILHCASTHQVGDISLLFSMQSHEVKVHQSGLTIATAISTATRNDGITRCGQANKIAGDNRVLSPVHIIDCKTIGMNSLWLF